MNRPTCQGISRYSMPSLQPAAMAPMPAAMPVLISAPPSSVQTAPCRWVRSRRGSSHRIMPRAALVIQPYSTACRCTVRTRPKVSQGCCTSQSGACSLMDAVSPAMEPSSSQKQAKAANMNTGKAVDWSATTRACRSVGSAWGRGSGWAACWNERWFSSRSAGSSTRPTSPRAKITEAAAGFSTSRPLRSDQMKTNSPMMDSRKAPSRLMTALSITPPLRPRPRRG